MLSNASSRAGHHAYKSRIELHAARVCHCNKCLPTAFRLQVGVFLQIVFFLLGICYGGNTFYHASQIYVESYHEVPEGQCRALVKAMAWVSQFLDSLGQTGTTVDCSQGQTGTTVDLTCNVKLTDPQHWLPNWQSQLSGGRWWHVCHHSIDSVIDSVKQQAAV